MDYTTWKKTYDEIVQDLNLDKHQDQIAAEILESLIRQHQKNYISLGVLSELITNQTVFVFGAAPSLEPSIKQHLTQFQKSVLIAADGATSALLKYDIIPNVIVTDLDGIVSDQIRANEQLSILVVHAHGDNMNIVQQTIPQIKGRYLGTIQTDPSDHIFVKNFGGFTDGDRSVFLADYFHARKIVLVGFDCDDNPGFYSFQQNKSQDKKQKKLAWCKRLLNQFPDKLITHI